MWLFPAVEPGNIGTISGEEVFSAHIVESLARMPLVGRPIRGENCAVVALATSLRWLKTSNTAWPQRSSLPAWPHVGTKSPQDGSAARATETSDFYTEVRSACIAY